MKLDRIFFWAEMYLSSCWSEEVTKMLDGESTMDKVNGWYSDLEKLRKMRKELFD